MMQRVADILPSAWWHNAVVYSLTCGHRHIRPVGWAETVGDLFDCCFCAEASPPKPDGRTLPPDGPSIGPDVPGGGAQ